MGLHEAVALAKVEAVEPFALEPATVSPLLGSMARAWHGALPEVECAIILRPLLPSLVGTAGSAALDERRIILAADWVVRCYLPNWLHRAGLVASAQELATLPEFTALPALLAMRPAIERMAGEANAAWVAARERVKAEVPPDSWGRVREDVRNAVRAIILASAEASVRVPHERVDLAKVDHFIWEAAAACFWAVGWDGVRTIPADGTIARVAAVMLPIRTGLNRQAMTVLARMAALRDDPPPAPFRRRPTGPAFFRLHEFPDVAALAGEWATMRDEVMALHAPLMGVDRIGKGHGEVVAEVVRRVTAGEPFGWVKGWGGEAGGNRNWTQFGLVIGDQPIQFAVPAAPRTLRLLSKLRGLKIAAFVRLAPGTLLPTHTHPEIGAEELLQAHITLTAPRDPHSAYLNVAGQFRAHRPGSAMVFDGSLPHFAVNAAAEPRVILYLEFDRAAHHRPRDTRPPVEAPAAVPQLVEA